MMPPPPREGVAQFLADIMRCTVSPPLSQTTPCPNNTGRRFRNFGTLEFGVSIACLVPRSQSGLFGMICGLGMVFCICCAC